jgi:tetratricopeptide (TPR) repeat protein
MQIKDYDKAGKIFEEALTFAPDNEEINFNLAVVHEKKHQFDKMVEYLKKTIEINPEHVEALNYLGYSYADRGINLDEALDLIEKAVKLEPDRGYIRDSLGWVYFKKGMYKEALREIKKAAVAEKEDPLILEHLGDVYLKLDNREAAAESWKKSLEFHDKQEGLKERVEEKIESLNKVTN